MDGEPTWSDKYLNITSETHSRFINTKDDTVAYIRKDHNSLEYFLELENDNTP